MGGGVEGGVWVGIDRYDNDGVHSDAESLMYFPLTGGRVGDSLQRYSSTAAQHPGGACYRLDTNHTILKCAHTGSTGPSTVK